MIWRIEWRAVALAGAVVMGNLAWPLSIAALIILLAVFAGVVLPAVWSRKASRRQDAERVLKTLVRVCSRESLENHTEPCRSGVRNRARRDRRSRRGPGRRGSGRRRTRAGTRAGSRS